MIGFISNSTHSHPVVPLKGTSALKSAGAKLNSAPTDSHQDSIHLSPAAQAVLAAAQAATETTQAARKAGDGDPQSLLK